MFLTLLKNRPRLRYNSSTSFARIILMIILFAAICWAFWANSERYTMKFSAAGRFHDEIDAFSDEQKKEIIKIIGRCNKDSGVKLRVTASRRIFASTDAVEGEIFFGINPAQKQIVIFMPPLWRSAMGEGFLYNIRTNMIEPSFDNGSWREESIKSLLLMEQRFAALAR